MDKLHMLEECCAMSRMQASCVSHVLLCRLAGGTVLHWAAASGDAELLGYLLERAVDVDSAAYSGQTPLHVAAAAGHERAVRLLLSDNAQPDMGAHACCSACCRSQIDSVEDV